MAEVNDEDRPDRDSPESPPTEPPYQALFPNLDKVSKRSFQKGTLSRRRVNIALAVLAVVLVVIIAVILFTSAR